MKPIPFNTEKVRAILEGRKTVTRRVVKADVRDDGIPWKFIRIDGPFAIMQKGGAVPFPIFRGRYQPGDILYVRETWGDYRECSLSGEDGYYYLYRADYPDGATSVPLPESERTDYADSYDLPRWRPSIHMPKEAARIFLRVTDVRLERLNEMTAEDSLREGVKLHLAGIMRGDPPLRPFADFWDTTIKKSDLDRYGWKADPWVWVISFERCEEPEEDAQC